MAFFLFLLALGETAHGLFQCIFLLQLRRSYSVTKITLPDSQTKACTPLLNTSTNVIFVKFNYHQRSFQFVTNPAILNKYLQYLWRSLIAYLSLWISIFLLIFEWPCYDVPTLFGLGTLDSALFSNLLPGKMRGVKNVRLREYFRKQSWVMK